MIVITPTIYASLEASLAELHSSTGTSTSSTAPATSPILSSSQSSISSPSPSPSTSAIAPTSTSSTSNFDVHLSLSLQIILAILVCVIVIALIAGALTCVFRANKSSKAEEFDPQPYVTEVHHHDGFVPVPDIAETPTWENESWQGSNELVLKREGNGRAELSNSPKRIELEGEIPDARPWS